MDTANAPKKKFRDTKLGSWLKDKSPKILEVAGDLLPDAGVLGVIGRLIATDPIMTPEEKTEAYSQMKELYELEVADRDSARKREVGISETGRFDFMFNLTGIIGLGAFVFIIYAIVFLEIPSENKEIWIHLIGICEGVVLSIFGYFFGSAVRKNVN
jgi:hypothetical protein|tara:strand:+ start:77 stop:547 length:471 start_codon:yes stop_codon:yes gene_type:complete